MTNGTFCPQGHNMNCSNKDVDEVFNALEQWKKRQQNIALPGTQHTGPKAVVASEMELFCMDCMRSYPVSACHGDQLSLVPCS